MIRWTRIKEDVVLPVEHTSTQTSQARITWRLRRRPMNAQPKVKPRV